MEDIFKGTQITRMEIGMRAKYENGHTWLNMDPGVGAYVIIPGSRLVFEIDPNGSGRVYRESAREHH